MAPAIPWIIGAAAVGFGAKSVMDSRNQAKAADKAAEQASKQNAAALQTVKDSQANASNNAQKVLAVRRRSGSQTVFTSPLGITTEAATAKKVLLGH